MTEIADAPLTPSASDPNPPARAQPLEAVVPSTTEPLPTDAGAPESLAPTSASTPSDHNSERFVKHANIMSALTILSRVFGLIRDKACATYLGNKSTEWSAFWLGFLLPNLSRRIFGEGALTAIFVPTYTRILHEKGPAAANRLASSTATLLITFLGSLTLIGEMIELPTALNSAAAAPDRLAALMTAIMLPYCVLVCLVALLGAIATVHERFIAQSISPIILNIAMAAAAIVPVVFWTHKAPLVQRITWVAIAVIVAGLLQVAQMFPTLHRCGVKIRPTLALRSTGVMEIVKAMIPMIIGLSAVQVNTYMDFRIAWFFSSDGHNQQSVVQFFHHAIKLPLDQGAVGILSVAQRLYLLPVGIFGVSMATAIFPMLAKAVTRNDTPEVKRLLIAGLRKTLFLSLPASIGMMFVAAPLINTLYASDLVERATWAAMWFCGGIWAFEAQMVIVRVYYAFNDRVTPMKVAICMVLLNFSLNAILVWFLREGGIALSTTLSAIIQSSILLFILRRRLGPLGLGGLRRAVTKGLISCAAMLGMLFAISALLKVLHPAAATHTRGVFFSAFVALPMLVLGAGVTYVVMALVLRMDELFDVPLIGKFLRQSRRPSATPTL